ncbi:hypothetical protein O181_019983 [Austropuccinia psidii MF-1]|uniref:Integrase catalytic domain-containing protein n=1 Tax=Austropuccinia psidii MF-1 TaxID=1389203 RepID=A0A9Q3CC34_9BASI|nr:hypothetical protein [Austropuccinia psidii MF-1]
MQIQEPKAPWGMFHMDWVTALPPEGDRSFNECLLLVDKDSKSPMLLSCDKYDTDMETAIMIWNRVISHTGLFQSIISDTDTKFTSELWKNLHNLFGTNLSFQKSQNPQKDGLSERMMQALEDMIKGSCVYGLEFQDSDGFTHDACTLLPDLELAYKTSIHSSTVKKTSSSIKRLESKNSL